MSRPKERRAAAAMKREVPEKAAPEQVCNALSVTYFMQQAVAKEKK